MGEIKNKDKSIFKNRSFALILIFAAIGIILLLWNTDLSSKNKVSNGNERLEEYRADLEMKIAELCSNVSGVNNVKVSVYFTSGFETVYAYNEESKDTSNGTNTEKKYVTVGSGSNESMVCIVEKMPVIGGIAIVCKGGGDSQTAKELISLISSAYGISKNKIYIAEGKN